MCSGNNIPSMDFSIALCVITGLCSSFFMVDYISLRLGQNSAIEVLAHKVSSSFSLSTSFIVVNA